MVGDKGAVGSTVRAIGTVKFVREVMPVGVRVVGAVGTVRVVGVMEAEGAEEAERVLEGIEAKEGRAGEVVRAGEVDGAVGAVEVVGIEAATEAADVTVWSENLLILILWWSSPERQEQETRTLPGPLQW
jgi:hypothetical protein